MDTIDMFKLKNKVKPSYKINVHYICHLLFTFTKCNTLLTKMEYSQKSQNKRFFIPILLNYLNSLGLFAWFLDIWGIVVSNKCGC